MDTKLDRKCPVEIYTSRIRTYYNLKYGVLCKNQQRSDLSVTCRGNMYSENFIEYRSTPVDYKPVVY
jgi:hypothetical protein